MNDRLLKKLILKEIHSVLNEGDEVEYGDLLDNLREELAKASGMAESLGKKSDHLKLKSAAKMVGELFRGLEGDDPEQNAPDIYPRDEDED